MENLVGGNRKLNFVAPRVVNDECRAYVSADMLQKAKLKWANSLVMYTVGARPSHAHLSAFIRRVWKPSGAFEVYSWKNGYYCVKFEKENDCVRILNGGPYFFDSRLIMLQKWQTGMKFNKQLLRSVPIWVRLELELELWDVDTISAIASVLGNPIELDCSSENASKVSFARVLVDMQASSSFPSIVKVDLFNGENTEVPVSYEYKLPSCGVCNSFGHHPQLCVAKRGWKQKQDRAQTATCSVAETGKMLQEMVMAPGGSVTPEAAVVESDVVPAKTEVTAAAAEVGATVVEEFHDPSTLSALEIDGLVQNAFVHLFPTFGFEEAISL